jgi:hypothetical protein
MKFTNKMDLPAPLCRAIEWQNDSHKMIEGVDISNTSLIDSPLIYWLKRHYKDQVVEDYADRIWPLYGTLAHLIMEMFGKDEEGEHVEATVVAPVGGLQVSTQIDAIFKSDEIVDYKWTSVWSFKEGPKDEYVAQLNIARYLMFLSTRYKLKDGEVITSDHFKAIASKIRRLRICAMFRDWGPRMAEEFPQPVQMFEIPLWSWDRVKAYVDSRVALHKVGIECDPNTPPPICSDAERWMTDFAIMRKGQAKAVKAKIATREEAERLLEEYQCDTVRDAEPRRCMDYCPYGKQGLCPYWNPKKQETICPVSPSKKSKTSSRKRYAGVAPTATRTKRSK